MVKPHRFVKFSIGGILVFFFEYGFTAFLVEVLGLIESLSYAISLIIGIFMLYFYHKNITFQIDHKCIKMFSKFFVVTGTTYFVNWVLSAILIIWFPYLIVIPLVNIGLSVFVYTINKKYIFKRKVLCEDFS